MNAYLLYAFVYPAAAGALFAVLVLMVRGRVPPIWLRTVTATAVLGSLIRLAYLAGSESWCFDYRIFWSVGRDIRAGLDPYSPSRYGSHPFLNPPTAFPLFALFGAMPPRAGVVAWSVL